MKYLTILFAACLFITSCETLKGVGRDVESSGEEIDEAIDEED